MSVHKSMSMSEAENGIPNPWHGPFKEYTNVFVVDKARNRILLGMKRRGFGVGLWNGFGGKVEMGESVMEAAERELLEEANVRARPALFKAGEILYRFGGKESDRTMLVHVFTCSGITGDPQESEEMTPRWHNLDEIPFDSMWIDDRAWFPLITLNAPIIDTNADSNFAIGANVQDINTGAHSAKEIGANEGDTDINAKSCSNGTHVNTLIHGVTNTSIDMNHHTDTIHVSPDIGTDTRLNTDIYAIIGAAMDNTTSNETDDSPGMTMNISLHTDTDYGENAHIISTIDANTDTHNDMDKATHDNPGIGLNICHGTDIDTGANSHSRSGTCKENTADIGGSSFPGRSAGRCNSEVDGMEQLGCEARQDIAQFRRAFFISSDAKNYEEVSLEI